MSKEKLGIEPAFPISSEAMKMRPPEHIGVGMSKRFYAACLAMQGLCSSELVGPGSFDFDSRAKDKINFIVQLSLEFADELLKQENV
jgi:hypothetical protein